MREFGYCLLVVGILWLIVAFNMETSVATSGSIYLPSRVENIGLIARRENHMYVAGLLIVISTLLVIFGSNKHAVISPARAENAREGAAERAPTEKVCVACKSSIPHDATRCKYCTEKQPERALEEPLATEVGLAPERADPGEATEAADINPSDGVVALVGVLLICLVIFLFVAALS